MTNEGGYSEQLCWKRPIPPSEKESKGAVGVAPTILVARHIREY